MGAMASLITILTIVYSIVYSGANKKKQQSFASLAFVWGIHRGPVNSPHKWPVTRKMFPFDDVIMNNWCYIESQNSLNIDSGNGLLPDNTMLLFDKKYLIVSEILRTAINTFCVYLCRLLITKCIQDLYSWTDNHFAQGPNITTLKPSNTTWRGGTSWSNYMFQVMACCPWRTKLET